MSKSLNQPGPRVSGCARGQKDLTIIPVLPQKVYVLKTSPGDVEFLVRVERVPGGTAVTLPEFDASSMILCTTDEDLAKRIRDAVERSRGNKTVKE